MKLKQKLTAAVIATLAAMTTTSVLAEASNTLPVANALTATDMASLFEQDVRPLQLVVLSEQEMRGTKGEIAPLVYVGAMTGTRFIVQRVVTQRVAQNLVRRGATDILAPNRAIAKNIAGRNPIRDFNPGPGNRYTHYHPNPRNGSHIWYGSPR